MIKKPHIVNLVYSLFIMILGLIGFFARYAEAGDLQFTALIPFIFGIIMLFLTKGIKQQNKIIAHIAVMLTMLVINLDNQFLIIRKGIIFLLLIISSFIALTIYIIRFFKIKKTQ